MMMVKAVLHMCSIMMRLPGRDVEAIGVRVSGSGIEYFASQHGAIRTEVIHVTHSWP